jgi:D-glycero-alpha-D-manno-heptose-7-phosphate kinase
VGEAESLLVSNSDINEFGKLLDHAWNLKRGISGKVSSDYIDDFYRKGMDAGAVGGKLLGAGGGGFVLFFAPPDRHSSIINALSDYIYVPVIFENEGTKIIHYSPEMGMGH